MAAVTPADFARAVLSQIGAPLTQDNIDAMVGWETAEGGNWNNDAAYNPLNTTEAEPGAGNTGTQGNIKVYRSWQQGISATVSTLTNGAYGGILAAFRKGNDPQGVAAAIGSSPWGTSSGLVSQTIAAASGQSYTTTPIPGGSASAPSSTSTAGGSSSSGSSIGAFLLKAALTFGLVGGGLALAGVGAKGALS
jgi:hypothetical protein